MINNYRVVGFEKFPTNTSALIYKLKLGQFLFVTKIIYYDKSPRAKFYDNPDIVI